MCCSQAGSLTPVEIRPGVAVHTDFPVEIYMPQVENQTHVLYNQVEGTDPAVTERLREVVSCVAAWTDSRGSPASTTENKRRSRWSARTGSR